MKRILPINAYDLKAEERLPRKEIVLAISYIDFHLHESAMTVNEIAYHANVSQDTLESMFRKWKDYTVVQYLLEVRLQKVEKMLIQSDGPINEIAFSCGFNDLPYFNRAFKKHFDISPSAFRKKDKLLRKKDKHS